MRAKEAAARIKINRLLDEAGWRFFGDESGPANIVLEPNTKITETQIDELGSDFETTKNGFLLDSADPEEREHIDATDQVREVLIHENYMSLIDLDFCARFDIAEFADHPHFPETEALHREVQGWVEGEEALAA